MDHIAYAYTRGMDEATVAERLADAQTGVLGLARGGEAYALPMAHHYEEGALYFRWGATEGSQKMALLPETDRACYVVYAAEPTADARELASWSILASGPIRMVPADVTDRFDAATINEHFAPIRVFDEDIEEMEISIVELEIEWLTGRETRPARPEDT